MRTFGAERSSFREVTGNDRPAERGSGAVAAASRPKETGDHMVVHVQAKPPLGDLFGFSKIGGAVQLEISVEPGTSLQGLFERLALQYPKFQRFSDPQDNKLRRLIIVKDGTVVVGVNWDQIALEDQSTIALFARYAGG